MENDQTPKVSTPLASKKDKLVIDSANESKKEDENNLLKEKKQQPPNEEKPEPESEKESSKVIKNIVVLKTKCYQVKVKTMLREEADISSKRLRMLQPGTILKAEKQLSGSVYITEPAVGWVSLETEGVHLLEEYELE